MLSELLLSPFLVTISLGILLMLMRKNAERHTYLLYGLFFILRSLLCITLIMSIPRCMLGLEYMRGYLYILTHTAFYTAWFSVIFPAKKLLRRYVPLYILAFCVGTMYAVTLALQPADNMDVILNNLWDGNLIRHLLQGQPLDPRFPILSVAVILTTLATVWLIYAFQSALTRSTLKFRKYTHDNYSYVERYTLGNFTLWQTLIFVCLALDVAIILFHQEWLQVVYVCFQLCYSTFLFYVITANWKGTKPHKLFFTFLQSNDKSRYAYFIADTGAAVEPMPTDKREELRDKLMVHFIHEKPFLSKRLTMTDVARAMNSNRTYISQVINNDFNTTFFEFVNVFRIEEVKRQIGEATSRSMKNIAESCGFSSYTTFSKYHSMYKKKSAEWYDSHARNGVL